MTLVVPANQLADYIGQDLEPSDWLLIDQERINLFADATLDHQFIHVSPEEAAKTPFGTTIAHGFLTLSLLSYLAPQNGLIPENAVMGINYGSDKVRFLQPVKVNDRIRCHARPLEVTEKSPGQWLMKTAISIEIENEEKPALVAELLNMFVVQ